VDYEIGFIEIYRPRVLTVELVKQLPYRFTDNRVLGSFVEPF